MWLAHRKSGLIQRRNSGDKGLNTLVCRACERVGHRGKDGAGRPYHRLGDRGARCAPSQCKRKEGTRVSKSEICNLLDWRGRKICTTPVSPSFIGTRASDSPPLRWGKTRTRFGDRTFVLGRVFSTGLATHFKWRCLAHEEGEDNKNHWENETGRHQRRAGALRLLICQEMAYRHEEGTHSTYA